MNRPLFNRLASLLTRVGSPATRPAGRRPGAAKRHARRLGFELCEDRALLSGASIAGIKFDTVSSSGFTPGTDVPQGGVFIDLYKETSNTTFDPATDTLVDRQQTAAGTGAYTFSNVADGHYYIKEEVPAGFTQSAPLAPTFYTVDVIGGSVYSSTTVTIDDFSNRPDNVSPPPAATEYFIKAVDPNPFMLTTTTTGTGILGGKRDLTVNVLGAPNNLSASGFIGVEPPATHGVFNLGEGALGPGTQVTMKYDGAGLAANLMAGGNNGIRFDFNFLQDSPNAPIAATLSATGPGGTATFTTTIATNPSGFSLFVPLTSFSKTGTFSFTNVSTLQFDFNTGGIQALDFELSEIVNPQQKSTGYNFGNFPLPSSLAGFVYCDANNNGNKDSGEPPISGVIITLMGTNDLGQSVTQTTTTSSSGAYLFSNLRPGVYKLTESQPINFIDGKDTIGSPGGTTSNDMFSNINLVADFNGVNNNFGERGLTPAYSSKRSLLFPAQPVNLTAVYSTAAAASAAAKNATPPAAPASAAVSATAHAAATTQSHVPSTPAAPKVVAATTRAASLRAFLLTAPKWRR